MSKRIVLPGPFVAEGESDLAAVAAMKARAFIEPGVSTSAYIDYVARNARDVFGVTLTIAGSTDEERAASLIGELLRTGLAFSADEAP
jgi:hypothetical protein